MKRTTFLFGLMLITIIFVTCEKNSDSARLRIIKIADNQAMENPMYTFEYNSDGQLSRFSEENYYTDIEYNNGKPIKLSLTENDSPAFTYITEILWTTDGFILENGYSVEYTLNSNGQIASETFGEDIDYYNWIGSDSLKIVRTTGTEKYKFGTGISPFKGVDIPILVGIRAGLGEWDEFQNSFCTIRFNDSYLSGIISYDYNEQNYPVKADIKYSNSSIHDYVYFQYESY